MVPDKFNMVDMGGIDLIMMQGEEVPGLYNRLVESIAQCRYQCLYNWLFDGVIIPPTYVELEVNENDEVAINEGVTVSEDDAIHIYSVEPPAPEPEIIPLLAEENGVYDVPSGVDGYGPVTVDVPSYTPVINPITVTENGTYNAPSGVDGYSPIVVNVPSGPVVPALPPEYQEVEYITFYGNEYLFVENLPSSYLIHVLASNSVSANESCVIGYREETNNNADFEVRFVTGDFNVWARSSGYTAQVMTTYPVGTSLNIVREMMCSCLNHTRGKFFIGRYYASVPVPFKGNLNFLTLYPGREAGVASSFQPIRKFIPCYRKLDEEVGLYEVYSSTFYTNQGTGELGKGPDVN